MNFSKLFLILASISTAPALASDVCETSCSTDCQSRISQWKTSILLHENYCGTTSTTPLVKLTCKPSEARPGKWYLERFTDTDRIGNYFNTKDDCLVAKSSRKADYLCMASESQAGKAFLG